MNLKLRGINVIVVCVFLLVGLASCVSNKKVAYLQDVPDTARFKVEEYMYTEPPIQPDDIISISIQTIDPLTSTALNQVGAPIPAVGASSSSSTGQQVITGFLVDKDGIVEVPMIGKMKLAGMSTFKARDLIKEKASVYFKNPTVSVRFANYKVTVLGEVLKPGTYALPNEKVSLLDVLGLAGDLTIYGRRTNVLLIRQNGKTKEFKRFDLTSSEIFKSPYFYLRQNDIIYVEPTKAKVSTLNQARTQVFTVVGTVVTLLIVILTRVNF